MSTAMSIPPQPLIVYPDSDGQPMADNTRQYEWIVTIKGGLDVVFWNDPKVFVAGNLLWYPVEGDPTIRQAPDAFVVFGRPKGDRGSYKQWEEDGIAPQVVFEIRSPGNRFGKMLDKFHFYERYGIEEYYIYDPDHHELEGWVREGDKLKEIPDMAGWVSPRLGIRFQLTPVELQIFGPDGQRFATYGELAAQRDQERRDKAEAVRRAEEQTRKAEKLAAQLRALGVEPES
jgi:Uma2 family endonuclease